MIDGKKIEKAAFKFAYNHGDISGRYSKSNVIAAFKAGVNYFLDNLWHDASEEPKDKSAILFRYTGSMCKWASLDEVDADDWKQTVKELSITRWLYIDDLLKGGK